jgi:hypothetical protein
MDPLVSLDRDQVTVEPGGQATVTVRVRNPGTIVEGYRVHVVGDAAGWTRVLPDELSVYPQEEAESLVVFAPPADARTSAGMVPFGVRVVSLVDPEAATVVEGDVSVAGISSLTLKLTPVTSKGRWSARHRVEVSNWGNGPVRLNLTASDPDESLGLLLHPDTVDLPVGVTETARLKVRPRKPAMKGTPTRHPFRVVATPLPDGAGSAAPLPPPAPYGYDPNRPGVDGAFEQRPILGRLVLLLVLLAALAAGAWILFGRDKDEKGTDEVALPPTPVGFAAGTLTHDSVQLRWTPSERVDTYTLLEVRPDSVGAPPLAVTNQIAGIPGTVSETVVGERTPETRYCFQLVAVRGELSSLPTEPLCVDTGTRSPLPPPADLQVEVIEGAPARARLTWTDASGGTAEHLVLRAGSAFETAPPGVTSLEVDLEPGSNCFAVQSRLDGATSDPSPEQCVDGPAATTTTAEGGSGSNGGSTASTGGSGTSTGGGGGDLGTVAIVQFFFVEDVGAQQRATDLAQDLVEAGAGDARVVQASDTPGLGLPANPDSFVVVLAGFADDAAARAACEAIPPAVVANPVCDVRTP